MSARAHWCALLAIGLTAVALRLWQINTLPPGFHFDESFEGLEAWRIFTDPSYRPIFLSGNFGVAPLNAYANALMFGLFALLGEEAGPTAMRVTAAGFGVLGVLAVYALAYELHAAAPCHFSPQFPFLAAAALAVMRWHIHFSRMGIEPILVPLIWAGAIWLLLRGWRTSHLWSFAGCGILLAAAMYSYQGAWIIPLLTALVCFHLLFSKSGIGPMGARSNPQFPIPSPQSKPIIGLAMAATVATLLVAPLAWFFWCNPDLFLLRPAQIAVVGRGDAADNGSFAAMVWATAQMFGPFGAPGDLDPRRNLPGAPALNLWLAIPFYLGLVIALRRSRQPAFSMMLIGLFGLLLPGVFSEYAPHFHRILGAAAPTALLCGLGLDWFWRRGRLSCTTERPLGHALRTITIGLLMLGAFTSVRDYFVRWAALPDLFYAFDVGLWQVGQTLADLPGGQPTYLTPRDPAHPTLAFALQTRGRSHAPPVAFDGRFVFPLTAKASAQPELYVVIEHEDFRTRLLLPEIFPTATIQQRLTDPAGQVYAHFYERPAHASPGRPPQQVLSVTLGDGIALLGYDVQPATLQPGKVLYLQLHWQVNAAPTHDWTVFTHLLTADGATQVAGRDSRPGNGSLPTLRWQPGWRILDEYQIALPINLKSGMYPLEIGLYAADNQRLPTDQPSVVLGEVRLE